MIQFQKHKSNYFYLALLIIMYNCINKNTLPGPLEAGWKGEAVCEIVEDNKELRVLKCTFEPGIGHEKHYHNPHFGYTLVGGKFRITDTTGIRNVDVPTGYSFSKNEISTHEVLNIGETTAVFLIMEYK
ncbi:cupin domain-containing protein [Winogradskyella sp. E313]|uniref:Cupin domain-containing protein n=2 Tax=Winogradskyella immobilis TaxID=2816852 RepID=A0ABS8EJN8_9FLAO|nr:cupin domain-containing protein [Winogradskyella immobilis]